MKIAFKTFGCRANSLDTDILYQEALRRGFEIVGDESLPDAYIVNSCTVTEEADKEAKTYLSQAKRKNPKSVGAIIGCYAQVAHEQLKELPYIDFIYGTANKLKVLDGIADAHTPKLNVERASGFLPKEFLGSRKARASVKIQDGCNFKCSYCIIPEARGRSRSLNEVEIIAQAEAARDQGFQEIVLTGIHLAHYGWDKNTNLLQLLEKLIAIDNGPRIRLSSLDPFEISEELIELVTQHPKLCPYFHIALQSGSDSILKKMRRFYKAEEFETVTQKIALKNSNCFVGVDVIVGFPGETEREFAETVACLERSYWTKLHVFPFSIRKNTPAEKLDGQVEKKEKEARSLRLRTWSDEKQTGFLRVQLGSRQALIAEKEIAPGVWQGHTANFVQAILRENQICRKQQYQVELTGLEVHGLRTVAELR